MCGALMCGSHLCRDNLSVDLEVFRRCYGPEMKQRDRCCELVRTIRITKNKCVVHSLMKAHCPSSLIGVFSMS